MQSSHSEPLRFTQGRLFAVMLRVAKHLSSSAQGKLREESAFLMNADFRLEAKKGLPRGSLIVKRQSSIVNYSYENRLLTL